MAKDTANALVVTTGGHTIESPETADALRRSLGDAPEGDISFMRFEDTLGRAHWVNIHEIVDIHDAE